jgi:hypothetical protein
MLSVLLEQGSYSFSRRPRALPPPFLAIIEFDFVLQKGQGPKCFDASHTVAK